MARKRWLSTNVSNDSRVAELASRAGVGAALLYTWCIPHAGDDARLSHDAEELLSQVAPILAMRNVLTVDDAQRFISAAVELGLLLPDDPYLRFPPRSFYGYQNYIGEERRSVSQQNAADRSNAVDPQQNRAFVNSSSSLSSSFSLDRYADATLNARARAREKDSSRSCLACSETLRRRSAHGLCSDCHGRALIQAKARSLNLEHVSQDDLVALARE
jgi:hypothetical protein